MREKLKRIVRDSKKKQHSDQVLADFLNEKKDFLKGMGELSSDVISILSEEQRRMILAIVKMQQIRADQIKTPLARVISIPIDSNQKEVIQLIKKSGHSRLPIYEEKDGRKKFSSVLYAKDILPSVIENSKKFKVSDYARETLVTPESQSILSLLTDMRQKSHHLALTVNEYGDVSGLITLEDILETIVGDIRDEFDSKVELIQQVEQNEYLIDGNTTLAEINIRLDMQLPEDKFNTLAGYLLHELKGVISKKSVLESNGVKFTIEKIQGQQIRLARVQKK